MTDTFLSTRSVASGPEAGDRPGPLVSVAWLAAHLDDPDLRLIHTSSQPEHYPAGHIRGAAWADLYHELNERGLDPEIPGVECHYLLPPRADVEVSATRWGVATGDRIVFCDDWARNRQAIRGLWLLRLYGWPADRIHVLDGGITAWQAAGHPLTADIVAARTVTPVVLDGGDPTSLATREQVAAWSAETLAGGPMRILDVRKPAEFVGTDLQSQRGGHVPCAANLDWEAFLHADNTFRSPAEIRALADAAVKAAGGEDASSLRAAYCQGGVRAAAAWFALNVLAGVPIANYARSWEEWGNRTDTPIEV